MSRFFCVLAALIALSCDMIDPPEPTPAYLIIPKIELVENENAEEGSLSHQITDAWVLVDDVNRGVYELPARVPILQTGSHKITVGPGILVNGIGSARTNYLFYTGWSQQMELVEGTEHQIVPEVQYRDESNLYAYLLVEDFESLGLSLQASGSARLSKTYHPDSVFEGGASANIMVSASEEDAICRTTDWFVLPRLNKQIYLELDYRCNMAVDVGVHLDNDTYSDEDYDVITLKATTEEGDGWNKVYINLTDAVSNAQNPQREYIYLRANRAFSDADEGFIAVDNIKIMYQQ